MASTTIHTLNYEILMNTDNFEKKGKATRTAIREQKKALMSIITPAERFQVELAKLNKLQQQGLVTGEAYRRKLAQLDKQYNTTEKQASKFGAVLKRSAKYGFAAAAAGGAVLGKVLDANVKKMDALAKTARALGTSTEFVTRLQFAAGQTSGLSDEQTAKALEKMTRRISEAAVGTGEAQAALKELGLDAQALAASDPEVAILAIADAMQSVSSESDILRLSTKLFDDEQARLGLTLKQTNSELRAQFSQADTLGKTLSALDAERAEAVASSIGEAKAAFGGMAQTIAVELLPALKSVVGYVTQMSDRLEAAQTVMLAVAKTSFDLKQNVFQNPMALFQKNIGDIDYAMQSQKAKAAAAAQVKAEEKRRKAASSAEAAIQASAPGRAQMWKDFAGGFSEVFMNELRDPLGQQSFGQPSPMVAEKIAAKVVDPMGSVTAGSSEAFKLANRIKTGKTIEQKAAMDTATNTGKMTELLTVLVGESANAVPVGL